MTSQVVNYEVVTQHSVDDLLREVRGQISLGWEPVGGISTLRHGNGVVFYQALVLRRSRP